MLTPVFSREELLELNRQGLIPGPKETDEGFAERVTFTKKDFEEQSVHLGSQDWQWASERLLSLYDFTPKWCVAYYSSRGLAPWHAAATWIDVSTNKPKDRSLCVKRIYKVQINPSKWVSWLVQKDELLAHEAAHVARVAFDEPATEELFAYYTSNTRWRQILGPLFKNSAESLCFVLLIFGATLGQIGEIIFDVSHLSSFFFGAAGMLMLGCFIRLMRTRSQLERAAKHLLSHLKDPTYLRAVLFRMSDAEIFAMSRGKKDWNDEELRWRVIRAAYFR